MVEHVGEPVEPARRHQERPRREAGLDRAAYDLLALGQEQPVLGLEVLAQLDVAQVAVVGQPRVGRRRDGGEGRHRPRSVSGRATRHDVADHDDRRRGDLLGGDPLGERAERGEHGALRGIVPSTITATGVSGSRPPSTRASAMAGAFSTAISSTSVPRSRATRRPLDERVGVAGRQVAGDDGEVVGDPAVGDRDAGRRRAPTSGRRQPGDDGDRHAGLAAGEQLLVAAAEDEVVAALEADHPLALRGRGRRAAR